MNSTSFLCGPRRREPKKIISVLPNSYTLLADKPAINGVELTKDTTLEDLGLKEANQPYNSINEFPTIGKTGVIYIDTSENTLYRWDDTDLKYYCVGSNSNEEIEIIFGGSL